MHIGFLLIYTQYLYKTVLCIQYGIIQKNPEHQNKLYIIFNREKPILDKISKSTTENNCNTNEGLNSSNINDNDLEAVGHKNSKLQFTYTNFLNSPITYELQEQKSDKGENGDTDFVNRYINNNDKLINEELEMPEKVTTSYKNIKKYVKRTKINYFESYFFGVVQIFRFNCFLAVLYILIFTSNYFFIKDVKVDETLVKESYIKNCRYGKTELFLTTVEDMLVVFLLFKGRKIFKYSLVLNEIRYLTIVEYFWVFIGPLIDVII